VFARFKLKLTEFHKMKNKFYLFLLALALSVTVIARPVLAETVSLECINTTSAVGSSGSAVVALQTALINKGFNIPAISSGVTVKGYYGQQTRSAVENYQRREGLPVTGLADLQTINKLNQSGCLGNKPGVPGAGAGTVTVSVSSDKSPITVVSPNGGENVFRGSTTTINWKGSRPPVTPAPECSSAGVCDFFMPFPRYYDVKLEPYHAPCVEECSWYVKPNPFIIARNIPAVSYGSYIWSGGTIEASNIGSTVSLGRYIVSVCQSGTSKCDSSDKYFNLITR
jgi:hypothetical protein